MPELHADMTIEEVLNIKPHAKSLFFEYGILSENSAVQSMETVREACATHNLGEDEVNALMEKLEVL